MNRFLTKCTATLQRLDTYLPALLLVCLLSWQNTVAVGAADWVTQPELVAADGQVLSASDFCNRGSVDSSGAHCIKCIAAGIGFFPILDTGLVAPSFVQLLLIRAPYIVPPHILYKGYDALWRGPPIS